MSSKITPPPIKEDMFTKPGILSRAWTMFFQKTYEGVQASHAAATVADTATIDMTLTGQEIKADLKDEAVTLAKMANMATASLLGRKTALAGPPEVLSTSDARTVLGLATTDSPEFAGINSTSLSRLAMQSFVETITGAAPALTPADFGKVHIYSHATTSPTYNLPSVAAGDIGATITFVKTGTGTITIDAADNDTIEDSGAGDTIYSSDTGRVSITLQLVGATAWKIIEATGTWTTTN